MRHLPMTLSVPLLTVLACGTDHHAVARVDASAGMSGSTASEPAALAGSGFAGAPPTTSTGGGGNSPSGSTGGQSSASAGASEGGVEAAGAGTSVMPTGGASTGGRAPGGVSGSGGTAITGGAQAKGGFPATGGGTSTGGASAGGTSGAGQGGNAGAGTCPAELPLLQDSCSAEGLSCHYTGCSATRDYCSATAACTDGHWELGYTDCVCPGTGGAAGAGGSPAGGSAGQGGATSGCEFTYTTPTVTSGTCQIASDSENSCGEAAQCICAGESDVQTCVAYLTVPRGGPTFSDYCGPTSSRSLADALQALAPAYQGAATVSEGCSEIPATLDY